MATPQNGQGCVSWAFLGFGLRFFGPRLPVRSRARISSADIGVSPESLNRWRYSSGPKKLSPFFIQTGSFFTHSSTVIVTAGDVPGDRKSTRLNSSHLGISYAVFCLKKN